MIKMSEYANRRNALMKQIGSSGMVILSAAEALLRNGDAFYPYRQNSDFYYLTGFEEAEAVLILAPGRKEGEYVLFNRARDRDREIWDGPRAGQEGACEEFGADQSFPIEALEDYLPSLMVGRETVHYPLGMNKNFDKLLFRVVNSIRTRSRGGIQAPVGFKDISPSIHEMRLFKGAAEVDLMRQAAHIAGKGHVRAMQVCRPEMNEYQLDAELTYAFQRHGARYHAYSSIVGAGRNTCVLHYIQNNQVIAEGDLVLVDAGAEYQHYASDITRTFPANGKFSPEQKAIYELVLSSQLAALESIKPGRLWTEAQDIIVNVLTQGLLDLGILKGSLAELLETQAYLPFYMHRSGHWLGLDVHDAGRYTIGDKWRALQPGMVLTVEPGLYISADLPHVDPCWHNIGVRIEDDVCVTEKGHDILSKETPKTVSDIESIMAG